MKIRKVKKGKKDIVPCLLLNQNTSGFSTEEPPENGFVLSLSELEWNSQTAFLPETKLEELGYIDSKNLKKNIKKLSDGITKKSLMEIIEIFEAVPKKSETKKELTQLFVELLCE